MSSIALKKVWRWIKTMMRKLLHRSKQKASIEAEPAPGVLTDLDKKLGREIQKRQAKGQIKVADTRQGGPNMPRYQFCPQGHGLKRRTRKTMGGAYYGCKKCGEFFVRAPRL